MHPRDLSIHDFTYELPQERIASKPLEERDASKLLVYRDNSIETTQYKKLADHLPEGCVLVFNNTKVIAARILFKKTTGGTIEIFCLEPYEEAREYSTIMAKTGSVRWKCLIGGASKWKEGSLQKVVEKPGEETVTLHAQLVERLSEAYVVQLSWQPVHLSFAEVIGEMGDTPLPPYIKRKPESVDKERYQTIYAREEGSVAAPTAGLHFTPEIFKSLEAKGIIQNFITLHVGAGTFKPVKATAMQDHEMHAEWIDVNIETIRSLLNKISNGIIAVGTTSVRTLESLYWMGVKLMSTPGISIDHLAIRQWEVYDEPLINTTTTLTQALESLLQWMDRTERERLLIQTQILIAPGYRFRVVRAIITNFHQPQSTLLLLVAAAIGPAWKNVYTYALDNDFRFLSYGDGCLLFLNHENMDTE